MNPARGGSLTEVVGILVGLALGAGMPDPTASATDSVAHARASYAAIWWVVAVVVRIVTAVVVGRQLAFMWRTRRSVEALALGTGAVLVAVVTIASHRFQSWYLMAALPLFALSCPPVWRRWWIACIAVAVPTELVHVLPKTAALFPVWTAASNGATVLTFLAWFRARYWTAPVVDAPLAPGTRSPEGP